MRISQEHRSITDTFNWQPMVNGVERDIPITVQYHPEALNQDVQQVHYYPGLGEEQRAARKGVHVLGEAGLPAVGVVLPFHHLPPEPIHIERIAKEVPHAVAEHYNERAGNSADLPVDMVGNSQGGGVVLLSAHAAPEKVDAIAAIVPVGLNSEAFGDHAHERTLTFLFRLGILNALGRREQNLLVDPVGNAAAIAEVGGRIAKDLKDGRLKGKLDFALSISLADEVQALLDGRDLRIFLGKRDPLFRPHEVDPALKAVDALHAREVIDGSHGTVHNRGGRRQLRHAAGWLKQVRDGRSPEQPDAEAA